MEVEERLESVKTYAWQTVRHDHVNCDRHDEGDTPRVSERTL